MENSSNIRAVLLTNTFAPYRAPVWKILSDHVQHLDVVLLRKQESNRNWIVQRPIGYDVHELSTKGLFIERIDSGLYWGGGVRRLLTKLEPTHLIVTSYSAPQFIEGILWARRRGIRVAQWYESHAKSSRFHSGPIRWLREIVLKMADTWIVPGTMTRNYLLEMGIREKSIYIAPNTVDVDIFSNPPQEALRDRDETRFLFVGRYIELKGADALITAFSRLGKKAKLRLVGYGPLENDLRKLAGNSKEIEFHPATTSPEETAEHYAWADIVVMPSTREVWGLVVNEALAAGCYVISSSVAAVTQDLIVNAPFDVGISVDTTLGVDALVGAMSCACEKVDRIRARRLEIINWGASFTPNATAQGIMHALIESTKQSAPTV